MLILGRYTGRDRSSRGRTNRRVYRYRHYPGGEKRMILAIIAVIFYVPLAVIFELTKNYMK